MHSALITGANRGLGLGLVAAMAARRPQTAIFAACRAPERAEELQRLQSEHKNIHILQLDMSNFDSFVDFAINMKELTKGSGLNLLVNNAGVSSRFSTIAYVKAEQLLNNFSVNTFGPILLTRELLEVLKMAAERNKSSPIGAERAAIVNISSILGSIASNDSGGYYPYRCSKAALNAATVSMSRDLKRDGIVAISMHPGWVKTDMGGKNAPLDTETSARGMLDTIFGLNENSSGRFYQYDGRELPW